MQASTFLALLVSACCAASGQVLLKLGAQGRNDLVGFINMHVASGIVLYGVGMLLWLYALSRLPLFVVYPFTMLTLLLVGVLGFVVLGERPGLMSLAGWGVIALGLGLVSLGSKA